MALSDLGSSFISPTQISVLLNDLTDSSRATASAGNTSAASSSRSTAASQRGEEEEVAEVDEQAFVNLFSFDAAPDSVRLPEDQVQLAIDRDGTMYYLVDVDTGRPYDTQSWILFEVPLTLLTHAAPDANLAAPGSWAPDFVALDDGGSGSGAD